MPMAADNYGTESELCFLGIANMLCIQFAQRSDCVSQCEDEGKGTEACSFVSQVSVIPFPLSVISLHTLKCLETHTHTLTRTHTRTQARTHTEAPI